MLVSKVSDQKKKGVWIERIERRTGVRERKGEKWKKGVSVRFEVWHRWDVP